MKNFLKEHVKQILFNSFHNNNIQNRELYGFWTLISSRILMVHSLSKCFEKTKLPTHWSLAIPKLYKRNMIKGNLFRAFRIGSDCKHELELIKEKYIQAGFLVKSSLQ